MVRNKIKYLLLACSLSGIFHAGAQSLNAHEALAREIFKELIEINTTHANGNTTPAAEAMARRLKAAGYSDKDVTVTGPNEKNKNLVVRLKGSGQMKPILLLAHLDVVEAKREDWSMDPFKLNEMDGFFYGRGSLDIKDGAAILVACMIRMKKEGFVPNRDLVLALTCGEESGAEYNGVEWLLQNKRSLVDAAFCINVDGGDPQIKNGKRIARTIQTSEKAVLNFSLEVKNPGGHSSVPPKENAIYRLSKALTNLGTYSFPVIFNETTRGYFEKVSMLESGPSSTYLKAIVRNPTDTIAINGLSDNPYYNAMLRTTCVATMVNAGHAINALPQTASAIVNCRVMPGTAQADVQRAIENAVNDPIVKITSLNTLRSNEPSPLTAELMQTTGTVTEKLWPGVAVFPVMEVGATDGVYLRGAGIPTYGISGVFVDEDDMRAHGKDERIGVKDFYDGVEYEYQLVKAFASSKK